jgi:hypothetical protein
MKPGKQSLLVVSVLIILLAPAQSAVADEEPIYGYQLMTQQEREEHRLKMRSFRTEQEREAYRQEHHKRMQERAKEKGVTLPDEPMPRRGMGPGGGMGSGSGMESGKRMGR